MLDSKSKSLKITKRVMEFPKEFEEFQILESLEVQEVYSAWAMWRRGLVSIFAISIYGCMLKLEKFQI